MSKLAAIQMASGSNVNANLNEAERLIQLAANAGANLVVLPENFAIMGMTEQDKLAVREPYLNGPIQQFLIEQAIKHNIWLVGGTIPLEVEDSSHVRAACVVFDSAGHAICRYDKIHLFDVVLAESGETYQESDTIEAGSDVVVIHSPFGNIGLAVCYDLRFPELFRQMSEQAVDIILIPSAFTAITGRAHWQPLLRARAIENLCYVLASAQGGYHVNGRETYGHSMIVDPWGLIIDQLDNGSGFVIAEIDLTKIQNTRKTFPVLEHRIIK